MQFAINPPSMTIIYQRQADTARTPQEIHEALEQTARTATESMAFWRELSDRNEQAGDRPTAQAMHEKAEALEEWIIAINNAQDAIEMVHPPGRSPADHMGHTKNLAMNAIKRAPVFA